MNTKHMPLIVAITLPVIFVLILALVTLVPNMSIKPQHDFIYTIPDEKSYDYGYDLVRYKNSYDLKDGKIVLKPISSAPVPRDKALSEVVYENAPLIYYYDIQNQTSREITFKEAQELTLQKGPSSPDGYTISYDTNHEGIFELFGSENDANYVITKGKGKKTLSGIVFDEMYYRADLNIIGWIK